LSEIYDFESFFVEAKAAEIKKRNEKALQNVINDTMAREEFERSLREVYAYAEKNKIDPNTVISIMSVYLQSYIDGAQT